MTIEFYLLHNMALANTPNMHRTLRNNDRKKDENPEGK